MKKYLIQKVKHMKRDDQIYTFTTHDGIILEKFLLKTVAPFLITNRIL